MARAHAASACVQSDSIKGLAQSIAKPAYHRLLIAEPALRRAVPTLIIAFLITICFGAFVQVIDQTRQKRAATKHDLLGAGRSAGRTARACRRRSGRIAPPPSNGCRTCCPASFRPGASPPAAMSSSPAPISAFSRGCRSMPRPARATGILDVISAAQSLSLARPQPAASPTSPCRMAAAHCATQRIVRSLPGQVIVIQEKIDSLWRSDAALSITLSATTGFVVLILGFAFHWQSTRAREGDLINDAVRGRIDTALNRGRCGLWDWDLSRGRIFWSQSMFTMLGLESRSDLLTFGEVNALVKSDDIDLFAIADQLISSKINHIDQSFRMQHTDGHWIWLRVRCELSQGAAAMAACI